MSEIEVFRELPSTNDLALERAASATRFPLLIITRHQSRGRGRGGNRWWSQPGALTFSLLMQPFWAADRPEQLPLVSLAVGVAICKAIRDIAPSLDVGLKWPNDVIVSHRKIAGVLIECPSRSSQGIVIGIGINVNNPLLAAPSEVSSRATSLVDETGSDQDLVKVLVSVLKQIDDQLSLLRDDRERLAQRWSDLCVLRGRKIRVTDGAGEYAGFCEGIGRDGRLVVRTPSEQLKCTTGTVQFIDLTGG